MNVHPARVSLLTLIALSTPCAMCMRPDGSKPSYATGLGLARKRAKRSASLMHSSATERQRRKRSASSASTPSSEKLPAFWCCAFCGLGCCILAAALGVRKAQRAACRRFRAGGGN